MQSKNKESLRNMSMVLRQMGKGTCTWLHIYPLHLIALFSMQDATERESKVKESVEKAKEAVAMDVKDGISWSMSDILAININIHYFPLFPLSLSLSLSPSSVSIQ